MGLLSIRYSRRFGRYLYSVVVRVFIYIPCGSCIDPWAEVEPLSPARLSSFISCSPLLSPLLLFLLTCFLSLYSVICAISSLALYCWLPNSHFCDSPRPFALHLHCQLRSSRGGGISTPQLSILYHDRNRGSTRPLLQRATRQIQSAGRTPCPSSPSAASLATTTRTRQDGQ